METPMIGGLDLASSPLSVHPGSALLAVNYECDENGNYRSLQGYTLVDDTVPGSGPILGCMIYDNNYYAIREDTGVAKLYQSDGASAWSYIAPSSGTMPVGKYTFDIGSFSAVSAPKLFMLAEGVGKPWAYDGTTLSEISGAPSGTAFLKIHAEHLFLANAQGTIVHSKAGDPDEWASGNGEIGCSDVITGMVSLPNGALCVTCEKSVRTLYGTGLSSWELKFFSRTNVRKYGGQSVGATAVFQTPGGITGLQAAETYGDFTMGDWAKKVDDLFRANVTATSSCTRTTHDQYWLFLGDTALIMRFYEGGGTGITTASFPDSIECCDTGLVNGVEEMILGDDAGNVYLYGNDATSFNGEEINTTLVTAHNFFGNANMKKKYRRVFFHVQSEDAKEITILPQYDWGHEDIARHHTILRDALAEGGSWDLSRWDEFAWSTPLVDQMAIKLYGAARSINFVINTSSSTTGTHTLISYITHLEERRPVRGQ